jgi:hypothetical protein
MAIDLVCLFFLFLFIYLFIFIFFQSPGVRYSGFIQTRVFPMLYLSDIRVGSNNSTRPNILGHQLTDYPSAREFLPECSWWYYSN